MHRRMLLLGAAGLAAAGSGRAAVQGDRLVLLGTKGGPSLRDPNQMPSANLLVVGGTPYLIDAGYGATYRLVEMGILLPTVRTVLITHNHSDHNLDLGPLIYNEWVNGLRDRVHVYGPHGIDQLVRLYLESNDIDIAIRMEDEGRPDPRTLVDVTVYGAGPVFEDPNVRVSALRNEHAPIESYSLKFATHGGKTIVFSGDTAYFPPLAEFAKGADILVHEAMYGPGMERLVQINPTAATLMKHLRAGHTLTEDVGRIATEAGVKHLVLNHFVPGGDPKITDADWVSGVREHYAGPVTVGRDRMEIPLT